MRQLLFVIVLGLLALAIWNIGERLSADAMGLAIGVVFGVLAGLPTAVLVLASGRARNEDAKAERGQDHAGGSYPYGQYPQQPPVIVLTSAPAAPQPEPEPRPRQWDPARALPAPTEAPRLFRMIGESGEVLEDDFV